MSCANNEKHTEKERTKDTWHFLTSLWSLCGRFVVALRSLGFARIRFLAVALFSLVFVLDFVINPINFHHFFYSLLKIITNLSVSLIIYKGITI